jgi:hypothetical protein
MRILSLIVPKKERLEVDSKSLGCIIHAGSSPASGTILKEKKPDCRNALWLFYSKDWIQFRDRGAF